MVIVRNQNIIFVIDQINGQIEWNTVSVGVEVNFTCSTIYNVQSDISLVETSQNSQICKINILEENFFSIKERNVWPLISSESWSNFNDILSSLSSEIPYSHYRITYYFPAFNLVYFLGVEVKLFLR